MDAGLAVLISIIGKKYLIFVMSLTDHSLEKIQLEVILVI